MEKPSQKWKDLRFPSCSWSGWIDAMISYETDKICSCLENVQSWLMNHTWICWHIRDGNGNLRPLWDRYLSEQYSYTSFKWRGYRGQQDKAFPSEAEGKRVLSAIQRYRYMVKQGQLSENQLEKQIAAVDEPASHCFRRERDSTRHKEKRHEVAIP
jgi:hypothetical protein